MTSQGGGLCSQLQIALKNGEVQFSGQFLQPVVVGLGSNQTTQFSNEIFHGKHIITNAAAIGDTGDAVINSVNPCKFDLGVQPQKPSQARH